MIQLIGDSSRVHPSVILVGTGTITLGKNAQIRANTVIEMNDGKIEIGDSSVIGYNSFIQSTGTMKIGKGTLIGPLSCLLASSHRITDVPLVNESMIRGQLIIGDNVWIGANCTINYNINIGSDSIIGANSFVNKDINVRDIVGGVPAKKIKER